MQRRRVLVTGASGQDGSYLIDHLVARGDEVVGVSRRPDAIDRPQVRLVQLDLLDHEQLRSLIREVRPDQCYHLAAYHRSSQAAGTSDSAESLSLEEAGYLELNLITTQRLLAALREYAPACRVFLAASSHVFGDVSVRPQTEDTPMVPNSLYGITKVASLHLGRVYRARHGMFCVSGILYNHESPRRGSAFVTTQIARAAVDVKRGQRSTLVLGDLEAEVDWGFAGDYVEAMALMLDAAVPEDFIIASGAVHKVREFAELAFAHVGLDWRAHVQQQALVHRPPSRSAYQGDISRISQRLGWRPKLTFAELVHMMVDHHARLASDGAPAH